MPVWSEGDYMLGTQEEWAFKSRTFPGQIKGVDEENGKLTVQLIGTREQYVVDVPVGGFHIKGVFSAWQRYMPTELEFVDITFTTTNQPRVVGISTYPGTADNGAYALVAKGAKDKIKGLDLVFRKLRCGEFDLRSSGSAGYYFTKDGHATLEAGPTNIQLDRDRSESFGDAGLWVRRGDGMEVRYGDVKRMLPGTFAEASVGTGPGQLPLNPTAAGAKEWKRILSVLTPPPGTPPLFLEQEEVGDVRDDLGIPVPGPYGVPLRARRRLYDNTGLIETVTVEVDAMGNTKVTLGPPAVAGGLELSGATSPLKASFLSVDISATTTVNIQATATCDVGGTAGLNLNAGGTADSPILRSAELLAYWANPAKFAVNTAFGPALVVPAPFVPGVETSLLGKVK